MSTTNAGTSDAGGRAPGGVRRLHDLLTAASFQLAVVCLGVIALSFCYEVVARYGFNAPTVWANPLVSYLLCATIFLALPEMTRTSQHISINILIDAVPSSIASVLSQLIRFLGFAACLLGAWITGTETGAQIIGDIWTISYFPVPKWLVSIFIPYGLVSAGFYFLRQLLGEQPPSGQPGGMP